MSIYFPPLIRNSNHAIWFESGYIIKDATWLQSESDKLVTFSQEVDLPQGWYVVSDKNYD